MIQILPISLRYDQRLFRRRLASVPHANRNIFIRNRFVQVRNECDYVFFSKEAPKSYFGNLLKFIRIISENVSVSYPDFQKE